MSLPTGIDRSQYPRYISLLSECLNRDRVRQTSIHLNVDWTPTSNSPASISWRGRVRNCVEGEVTRTSNEAYSSFLSVIATPSPEDRGDKQLDAGARVLIQFFPEGLTWADEAYEAQRTIFAHIARTDATPGQQYHKQIATDPRFAFPKLVGAATYRAHKEGVPDLDFNCRVLIFNGERLTDDTNKLIGTHYGMGALKGRPKYVEALDEFVKHLDLRGIASGNVDAYVRFAYSGQGPDLSITVIVTALLDAVIEDDAEKEAREKAIAGNLKMPSYIKQVVTKGFWAGK
ncbi:hypothetical protein FA95DRAFT_1569602 [Auriscalpium vulgare]|uniref:Uncharacterized protein n=1 Tax=Auriscalpium vulgare TaxID=40419 RepID=A0ACB8S7Z3_9AGAM|nr:hypothetical protein FA95DRAFT_1569602 [Auriscalpium vulgare]